MSPPNSVSSTSQYVLPNHTPIMALDCREAFEQLNPDQRLYAHYISRASWYGGLICLYQTSPESPGIYLLLHKLFQPAATTLDKAGGDDDGPAPRGLLSVVHDDWLKGSVGREEVEAVFVYAAGVFANMGNYKSFGDTKFIPGLPCSTFKTIIQSSPAWNPDLECLWNAVRDPMYSLNKRVKQLGLGEEGISTYFSYNCTKEDAKLAQRFLDAKFISAYNTRLFKDKKGNYTIRLASAERSRHPGSGDRRLPACGGGFGASDSCHVFEGRSFSVVRGDYAPLLQRVVDYLKKAKEVCANETERLMLDNYVESFQTGSLEAHKDASRHWIKDKGPVVESYIGFIESLRDPAGTRGEFEGFVAVVNKAMSAKFGHLVESSIDFIKELPWPSEFEKDCFLRPDFTSLDVVTFGGTGIPAGINIPNYNEIRQDEGFKNVSLGNVISSTSPTEIITFLSEEDKALYRDWRGKSFEVQVGLHELLGHGSGKLFAEKEEEAKPGPTASCRLNFDWETVRNPLTGKPITTWYKKGETYDAKFSSIASTYEECRAECVGIYLCLLTPVLRIFGYEGDDAELCKYVNWLVMVRAGLCALEFYNPDTGGWGQAHMQARYVILSVLLEAGQGLVTIDRTTGSEDGEPDLRLSLDRTKIETVGREAIGQFLIKLQTYKSLGDFASASAMYSKYSSVSEQFIAYREIVLARKQPRKMFVLANTFLNEEETDVVLQEYPPSFDGLVLSFLRRFESDWSELANHLHALWISDADWFKL